MRRCLVLAAASLLFAAWQAPSAFAQASQGPQAIIGIYHVAPGQHVAFLEWMAKQEAVSEEAGLTATQWYAHMDGDSWDYLSIGPVTTDEQDAKVAALAKQKGMPTGPPASVEFRKYINSHTDTYVAGPMSVSALLAAVKGQ